MRVIDYIGNIEQLAYARPSVLADGPGRGGRIIDVCNGSGLQFTIHPDRGMDIVEASVWGIPVAFRSSSGICSNWSYEPESYGWLRNFQGGLLTTCGLRNAGVPNGEFGLHGRVSNAAASDVGIVREWAGDKYCLRVRGVLSEARMFGENLRMVRTIETAMGENSVQISDSLTNLANKPDYVQIIYHCNFGYPLVAPEAELEAEPHKVISRDSEADAGLPCWNLMPEPVHGALEQCFFHELPGRLGEMSILNRKAGLKATVRYDTSTLPRMVQWKLFDKGNYVLGLEPTNTKLSGRTNEIAEGTARKIEPGETIDFRVRIDFQRAN